MSMARNPNSPSRISTFTAGLIAIGVAVLAWWLAFGGLPFKDKFELQVVVNQANELGPRSPVRIAGVEVGKVKSVERGKGKTSILTIALDDEALPIHKDATVKIRPRIFLEGNFFVDLKPGTPGAPVLDEHDTIPLSQTSTPVQLDQILTTLQHSTRENLRSLVRGFAESMDAGGAKALNEAFGASEQAFVGVSQTAEATRGEEEGDLAGFIDSGGQVAEAAASGNRLPDLVQGLNQSVRGLAARRTELAASLPELDATLAEADPAFDALDRAFPPARAFVREARPGLRAAPETLRLANPVLDQVRALVSQRELPALLDQLDPAIDSLASLTPQLTEIFDLVTPVTECLRVNAVPTLKKQIDDDHLSTGEPVYRSLLYGLVGLTSASQNFDGNGPAVRYHAGFGDQTVTLGPAATTQEPLVGLTSEPILGSRPKYTPGQEPPFRPDVPCISQQPPKLASDTGPAPRQRRVRASRKLPTVGRGGALARQLRNWVGEGR